MYIIKEVGEFFYIISIIYIYLININMSFQINLAKIYLNLCAERYINQKVKIS
jgi:hypothetical protein